MKAFESGRMLLMCLVVGVYVCLEKPFAAMFIRPRCIEGLEAVVFHRILQECHIPKTVSVVSIIIPA